MKKWKSKIMVWEKRKQVAWIWVAVFKLDDVTVGSETLVISIPRGWWRNDPNGRCTVSWTGSLVRCNQCSCWLKLRKECWWNLDVAESGCRTRCDCLFSATWARRFSCPRRGRWQSAGYPSSKWGFQAGKQSHPHLCLVHSKPQRVQHLARDRSCTCHSLLQDRNAWSLYNSCNTEIRNKQLFLSFNCFIFRIG